MSNYEIAEFAPLEDRDDLPEDVNQIPSWLQHEMSWLTIEGQAFMEIERVTGMKCHDQESI